MALKKWQDSPKEEVTEEIEPQEGQEQAGLDEEIIALYEKDAQADKETNTEKTTTSNTSEKEGVDKVQDIGENNDSYGL